MNPLARLCDDWIYLPRGCMRQYMRSAGRGRDEVEISADRGGVDTRTQADAEDFMLRALASVQRLHVCLCPTCSQKDFRKCDRFNWTDPT